MLGVLVRAPFAPIKAFSVENLTAWRVVPFDAKKRGPEERAEMLQRPGFKRFAMRLPDLGLVYRPIVRRPFPNFLKGQRDLLTVPIVIISRWRFVGAGV